MLERGYIISRKRGPMPRSVLARPGRASIARRGFGMVSGNRMVSSPREPCEDGSRCTPASRPRCSLSVLPPWRTNASPSTPRERSVPSRANPTDCLAFRAIFGHTSQNSNRRFWSLGGVHFLGDGLGLQEEQQVIGAAGLRVRAGHIKAAEGVAADHGTGAFAIHVEIADVEILGGAFDFARVARIDGAGEAEFAVVRHAKGVVKILCLGDGEDRPEDFLLKNAGLGCNVRDYGRLDEVAIAIGGLLH